MTRFHYSQFSGREQLLHLLAEAAELEHNLLCCYLYAAFTLKRSSADLSMHEQALVEKWRKSLMKISFEEMTHLAIIANLTVAVGGRPHFNRPNLPVAEGYHPAGIVAKLAPFSIETLDHFIFLERPADAHVADGSGFEPVTAIERDTPPETPLMPAAPEYETIGEFYDAVRECLTSLSRDLGEEALFCCGDGHQLGEEALHMPGLKTIRNLPDALQAIETIVEQGEGSASTSKDSHFSRFREMRDEYSQGLAKREEFAPAWPAATNPVMRKTEIPDRVLIESPRALEILDLANAAYNLLLRVLVQAYGRGTGQAGPPPDVAFKLMSVLAMTGEYLATMPADDKHPDVHAGVTFTMLRATEPLIEGDGERRLMGERLEQLRLRTAALCRGHPELRKAREVLDDMVAEFGR